MKRAAQRFAEQEPHHWHLTQVVHAAELGSVLGRDTDPHVRRPAGAVTGQRVASQFGQPGFEFFAGVGSDGLGLACLGTDEEFGSCPSVTAPAPGTALEARGQGIRPNDLSSEAARRAKRSFGTLAREVGRAKPGRKGTDRRPAPVPDRGSGLFACLSGAQSFAVGAGNCRRRVSPSVHGCDSGTDRECTGGEHPCFP